MTDRKLLNLVQSSLPMVNRPYLKLGKELGIGEQEVLDRLAGLKRRNVLRQISAIFDTRRLGFKTTLVAMAYDPDKLNRGARQINRHPGVSHNYAREGSYYNLWFTLAVPPDHDLEATAQKMARDTQALTMRIMPTIRFFKIGVNFDMVNRKGSSYNFSPDGFDDEPRKRLEQAGTHLRTGQSRHSGTSGGPAPGIPSFRRHGPASQPDHGGAVRAGQGVSTAPYYAPVQRGAAPPPLRLQRQRHDCLAGAAGTVGRGGDDHGPAYRRYPLLRAPNFPRLALHPLHHDPRHFYRRVARK